MWNGKATPKVYDFFLPKAKVGVMNVFFVCFFFRVNMFLVGRVIVAGDEILIFFLKLDFEG